MTRRRYEDRPGAARRRVTARALLHPVVTAACLVALYFVAPLNERFTVVTALGLVGCLVLLVLLIGWQARAIERSSHPRLRAIEALAVVVPLFLLLFATTYVVMGNSQDDAFSEPLTRTDALYFTMEVFSTVGFGDITPRSQAARVLTIVQMLGDLLIIGLAARVLVDAVRRGLRRRGGGGMAGS
ncbi:MAG TPA: potassium channel family protein [Streptosporangiaceae bacterium]|nr:potassium channel family protein [Streptosporangiaceae bacterium]